MSFLLFVRIYVKSCSNLAARKPLSRGDAGFIALVAIAITPPRHPPPAVEGWQFGFGSLAELKLSKDRTDQGTSVLGSGLVEDTCAHWPLHDVFTIDIYPAFVLFNIIH